MAPTVTAEPAFTESARFEFERSAAIQHINTYELGKQRSSLSCAQCDLNNIVESACRDLDALGEISSLIQSEVDQYLRNDIREIWRIVGRYDELLQKLNDQPFDVGSELDKNSRYRVGIFITVKEMPIPPAAGDLKREIDSSLNIIQSVMNDKRDRVGNSNYGERIAKIDVAFDDYLRQLEDIARVGLMTCEPTRTAFARQDLVRLQNLVTVREAGDVKNSYVISLFKWCGVATVIFTCTYILSMTLLKQSSEGSIFQSLFALRNFSLLAVGTSVGTWLSFSIRKQELQFQDLAVLETDRLIPSTRVVYMIGLSSLLGLSLFTGAIVAGLGTVTGSQALHSHGSWALLIGLLSGLAERALGIVVSKESSRFVGEGDEKRHIKV